MAWPTPTTKGSSTATSSPRTSCWRQAVSPSWSTSAWPPQWVPVAAPGTGSPTYSSPEAAAGEPLGIASDLYSAGLVLYELLSGDVPIGGGAVLGQVAALSALPAPVTTLLRSALASDPTERPASAASSWRICASPLRRAVGATGGVEPSSRHSSSPPPLEPRAPWVRPRQALRFLLKSAPGPPPAKAWQKLPACSVPTLRRRRRRRCRRRGCRDAHRGCGSQRRERIPFTNRRQGDTGREGGHDDLAGPFDHLDLADPDHQRLGRELRGAYTISLPAADAACGSPSLNGEALTVNGTSATITPVGGGTPLNGSVSATGTTFTAHLTNGITDAPGAIVVDLTGSVQPDGSISGQSQNGGVYPGGTNGFSCNGPFLAIRSSSASSPGGAQAATAPSTGSSGSGSGSEAAASAAAAQWYAQGTNLCAVNPPGQAPPVSPTTIPASSIPVTWSQFTPGQGGSGQAGDGATGGPGQFTATYQNGTWSFTPLFNFC